MLLLAPARLTPLVNKYADNYLDARVNFDTVDISYWEEFPMVTLKLKNGSIQSRVFHERADTLLSFSELKLSTEVLTLLNNRFNVRRITIKQPRVSVYVDSTGLANYAIYKSTDTTTSDSDLQVNIDRIVISGGAHVRYDNRADSLEVEADFERLRLAGRLTNVIENIELSQLKMLNMQYKLRMDTLLVTQNIDSLVFKQKVGLKYSINLSSQAKVSLDTSVTYMLNLMGGLSLDSLMSPNMGLRMDSLMCQFNGTKMVLDGDLMMQGDTIRSYMKVSVRPLDFANIVEFMPPNMVFDTDLRADIDTRISGCLTNDWDVLPRVELSMELKGGSFNMHQHNIELKDMMMRASMQFDMAKPDSSGFVIDTISISSKALDLNGRMSVWNLLRDPKITASVHVKVDLDSLKLLRNVEFIDTARGVVDLDGSCCFTLSDFTPKKIGRCDVRLRMSSDDFQISVPSQQIGLMARKLSISLGSNASSRDTTLIEKGTRILRASVRADTAIFRMKDQLYVNVGGVRASVRSAASKYSGDTTMIHPFVGTIDARILGGETQDSMRIRVREPKILFTVLPHQNNKIIPELSTKLSARHVMMSARVGRWSISRPEFEAKAYFASADPKSALSRQRRLDSLQRIYPLVQRDSLVIFAAMMNTLTRAKDDFVAGDIDLKLDDNFGKLLRKWNVTGRLKATRSRVITPLLPLTNRIENIDIEFSHNDINLNQTRFRLGESNMVATGHVGNLRRALLGHGALSLNLGLEADTININQLIVAANQGYEMLENHDDALDASQSDQELQDRIEMVAAENIENSLLIIPSNINAEIKLNANYGKYATLELNELRSVFQMKERCMQITYIVARTNSGDMTLSGIYATKSRDNITFGVDVQMEKMHVDKLIEMVPAIDTLYPMLRSFEGVIDCKMAATAALDTTMNVKLETLRAACSIDGSNMVLLDGETFTEISKMMKFKNRKRNMIDRMSVEMLIRDSRIETFPFVLSMDRYKAAVSGIHNLDMSFNYHISVLKSPIPFRMGIDIFGTLDNWDFKIGRARYKSENVPSYVELIDDTRMNLSRKIYDIFQKGIGSASLENINVVHAANDTIVPMVKVEELTPADSVLLRENGIIE